MKDDFGFEIPVETVPLPSRGIIYPVDSAMHGKETVQIRAMTAREEDILTSKALIKKGTVITQLLQSCIVDEGFDAELMLSGDRNALMTALRITGYGTDYNVEVDCPACSQRSKQSFNLAELPIKRLMVEPVSIGANVFEIELPVTKKRARFKFLTGKDEQEIAIISERKKKTGQLADNLVTTRLTYSLVSVDNITDKSKLSFFIRNMPARDSLYIRKYIDKQEPGVEMKAWMDCTSCLESSEVRMPLGANFFWPDS
tara:strand:- start:884 stop:1654 length:771 start_codon:yes stop_codon:yes gene_type:complete